MPNYYNASQQMLGNLFKQRENIDNLINQYSQPTQPVQPINNYINTGSNVELEAKILKDNETIDTVIVNRKTLFVDEKNKRVVIKEVNGDISKQYDIIVPLDPKDEKIQELEKELNKLKAKLDKVDKVGGEEDDKKHK